MNFRQTELRLAIGEIVTCLRALSRGGHAELTIDADGECTIEINSALLWTPAETLTVEQVVERLVKAVEEDMEEVFKTDPDRKGTLLGMPYGKATQDPYMELCRNSIAAVGRPLVPVLSPEDQLNAELKARTQAMLDEENARLRGGGPA